MLARKHNLELYWSKRINHGGAKVDTLTDKGLTIPESWRPELILKLFTDTLEKDGTVTKELESFAAELRKISKFIRKPTLGNASEVANNAIMVDDPKIHFFRALDNAIESVRSGIYRAGALHGLRYDDTMRNQGVQNAIEIIDHLSDHIEKVIAKNGAHTRTFQNAVQRNELIKTQVSGIKGDTIGTDIAETYNKFTNLSNNYQAVLSSTNRINNLSLVNYLN